MQEMIQEQDCEEARAEQDQCWSNADPSPPVDALGHRRLHLPTLSRALCFLIMMFKDDHCFIIFALVHCPIHLPMLPRPLLPDPEDHFDRHFIKTYDHPYDADYLHT